MRPRPAAAAKHRSLRPEVGTERRVRPQALQTERTENRSDAYTTTRAARMRFGVLVYSP